MRRCECGRTWRPLFEPDLFIQQAPNIAFQLFAHEFGHFRLRVEDGVEATHAALLVEQDDAEVVLIKRFAADRQ